MRTHTQLRFTPSRLALALAGCVALLAAVASGAGLFWAAPEAPSSLLTARGEHVDLFARGLYRYDSIFVGAGNRGTDTVTLALGIPLLLAAAAGYRRGSPRAGAWLLGAFVWHVYVYASYALGATAYNELFLVYVAAFSASSFGLFATHGSLAAAADRVVLRPRRPRVALGWFLAFSAVATLLIWISIPVGAMASGTTPVGLSHYSTLFTVAVDIAVLVPIVALAAHWTLRNHLEAPLLAFPVLVLEAFLLPAIVLQTAFQLSAGIALTPAEIAGPVAGFVALAGGAVFFLRHLHRGAFARGGTVARTRRPRSGSARIVPPS